MNTLIQKLLREENITELASLPLSECIIKKPYLLEKCGIDKGTVFFFLIPYLSKEAFYAERNLSLYACAYDYHLYFQQLMERILPELREQFPTNHFAGFCDHSPVDEVNGACKAGLGIMGENGLVINKKYGSFVFIGEIITDAETDAVSHEILHCNNCLACKKICPAEPGQCLSALTQRKGEYTECETKLIRENKTVWGCDLCQLACPINQNVIQNGTAFTPISFFRENIFPELTSQTLPDCLFEKRAYSWRGIETIRKNLKIIEETEC